MNQTSPTDKRANRLPLYKSEMKPTLGIAFLCALVSCKSGVQNDRTEQAPTKHIISTVTDDAQKTIITYKESGTDKRVAEVQLNQGSLAVEPNVTISSTYHTDLAEVSADFGIDANAGLEETQVAVVVSSDNVTSLDQPMTIALELPSEGLGFRLGSGLGLGLKWNDRHYIVVYTVQDPVQGLWKRGVMPDAALTIKDGRVIFQSQMFGRFELFEVAAPLETIPKEVVTPEPDFRNPPLAIRQILPLVAQVGKTVTIKGLYLSSETKVYVGSEEVAAKFTPKRTLQIVLPHVPFGKNTIKIQVKASAASADFIAKATDDDLPYLAALPATVCKGLSYLDGDGQTREGEKVCTVPACSSDGEEGCLASEDFPSLDPGDVPVNQMFNKQTIVGEQGKLATPSHSVACKDNGQKDCRITGDFVAAAYGAFDPDNVRKGVRIPKAIAGGSDDLVGTYPTVGNRLPGFNVIRFTLSASNFSTMLTNTILGVAYQYWDAHGNRYKFAGDNSITSSVIVNGVEIHGVKGKLPEGALDRCDKSGQSGCFAAAPLVAEKSAHLAPQYIRNGHAVGDVTGSYPSSQYPLEGATTVKDLTDTSFDSSMAADDPFEFFDGTGKRHQAQGSALLDPQHIKDGITIYDQTGTLGAVDTSLYKPENIRAGISYGSVTGAMKIGCRNMTNIEVFNFDSDLGTPKTDPYDTIQDGLRPTENPWPEHSEYACGAENFDDVTVNDDATIGCKTLEAKCMFKDIQTGLYWAGFNNTPESYADAASRCQSLNLGGEQWRLPTIHELMAAYVMGMNFIKSKATGQYIGFFNHTQLWSGTRNLVTDPNANGPVLQRVMNPATGLTTDQAGDSNYTTGLCVRP